MKTCAIIVLSLCGSVAFSQKGTISGKVVDENNVAVPSVNILLEADNQVGTISDAEGNFQVTLPTGPQVLVFSHIQYETRNLPVTVKEVENEDLQVVLSIKSTLLEAVEIEAKEEKDAIDPATKLKGKSVRNVPSTFGDFSKVLVTLPGVASNNELSSAYNVRGGNFDENLVYVNDIPVYRPFLANAGRQEGLSFVNTDLVEDINFYAGGWEAKYGDKLSSSLNILYKEPRKLEGNINLGLLGGSAYIGNQVSDRVKYIFGARHRDTRYLLNTLETQGQYLPTYTDVQSFFTFDLSKKGDRINRTKLNWLLSYGRNRYLTLPESQTTEFGSISETLRIETAFEGREQLDYDTYQTGLNLSHRWSDRFLSRWIASGVYTTETEYFNVEGAYRICDVDNNPGSNGFNDCVVVRGIGTNFDFGRNKLEATLINAEWRNEFLVSDYLLLEAGVGINSNEINDQLNEFSYLDSAGFIVNPANPESNLISSIFNELDLTTTTYTGYLQTTVFSKDSSHAFNLGARVNHLDYTGETLWSPRMIYRYRTGWERETSFRLSLGRYSQPPFYREFRDLDGNIRNDLVAQKSSHIILGMERLFNWWNRPFLFTAEGYYKVLDDVIPYDIDNVRLRYFADNNAKAFAYGFDFRLNGEFIPDTQSWFSLGILKTREDLEEDNRGYIRRPTDQHINLAFFFEDHMPNDPSVRVYVNTVFGSGFPLGPPNEIDARNIFSGDEYFRVDMGFSKSFELKNNKYLKTLWLRAEVLNALGADNTLSYSWIQDINGGQLAIPNSLSARFLNIRVSADF
ncbi:MAG: carboxypeptidase-like regulatory domain-containing protein [Bacteroidota bacterium]